MKLSLLLLASAAMFLTGCQTYTKFRVTNYRDEMVAEWIARGHVARAGRGYRITAVQRLSGGAYPTLSRYPDGWRTTVDGPHIVRARCGKPFWLYQMEKGEVVPMRVVMSRRETFK